MKVAIMQPYFLPYIGYWQLMGAVDVFVVYDNIKYTKKGWINRNRLLRNGEAVTFSLPLEQGSDSLDVRDRRLASTFEPQRLLAQFEGAYAKAPFRAEVMALLRGIVEFGDPNLFRYLRHSIERVGAHLGLAPRLVTSSEVPIDHGLRAQDKVIALCEALGATHYVNPIGGTELYDRETFAGRGIELRFLKAGPLEYAQTGGGFVPWLSIVDILMFNPIADVRSRLLAQYELLRPTGGEASVELTAQQGNS